MSTRQRCLAQGVLTPNWLKLKNFRASASERAKNIVLMAQRVPPHPPPNWLILKCERAQASEQKKLLLFMWWFLESIEKNFLRSRGSLLKPAIVWFLTQGRARKKPFFWVKMVRQPPGVASPRAPPELKIKTFRERAKRASEIFLGFWHWGNAAEAYLDQKLRKKIFFKFWVSSGTFLAITRVWTTICAQTPVVGSPKSRPSPIGLKMVPFDSSRRADSKYI